MRAGFEFLTKVFSNIALGFNVQECKNFNFFHVHLQFVQLKLKFNGILRGICWSKFKTELTPTQIKHA